MLKRKRRKYNFLSEQKKLSNPQAVAQKYKEFETDWYLARYLLDKYSQQGLQLYERFQEEFNGLEPGCIYVRVEQEKGFLITPSGERMGSAEINFVPKKIVREKFQEFPNYPGIGNLLRRIEIWEESRCYIPIAVQVGYAILTGSLGLPGTVVIIDEKTGKPIPLLPDSEPSLIQLPEFSEKLFICER